MCWIAGLVRSKQAQQIRIIDAGICQLKIPAIAQHFQFKSQQAVVGNICHDVDKVGYIMFYSILKVAVVVSK